MEGEVSVMTAFLTTMGEAGTWLVEKTGDIGEMIVSTPVLVFPLAVFAIGACIGLFGRLLHRG